MYITAISFKTESSDDYLVVSGAMMLGDLENSVRQELGEELPYASIVICKSSVFPEAHVRDWFKELVETDEE